MIKRITPQEENASREYVRTSGLGNAHLKNTESNDKQELQLEIGNTYIDGYEDEVKIVSRDSDSLYPFNGDNGESYTENGKYYSFVEKDKQDLVSEKPHAQYAYAFPPPHNFVSFDYAQPVHDDLMDAFGRLEAKQFLRNNCTNPKDLMGVKKPPLSLIPPVGLIHEAMAMKYGAYEAKQKDGTLGYGPYNWRSNKVQAMIYIDAIMRHAQCYLDREDIAKDSKVHHLGHIKACCSILLDAIEAGNLVDNRPLKGNAAAVLERFTAC